MEKPANDLIVNSKGHCFFCLRKISDKFTVTGSSARHPLHRLSKYLKMDLTKVFNQKGSIPPSLLAKVEQSRLKVEMCGECTSLNKNISQLCQQLEKIKMEIDSKLGYLQDKLLNADGLGRGEQLGRFGDDQGLIQVLEVLRTETMDKCSHRLRLRELSPRVKISKLTRKQVNSSLRIRGNNADLPRNSIMNTLPGLQSNNQAKREDQNDLVWDGESGGNDFLEDMPGMDEYDINSATEKTEESPTMTATSDAAENKKIENSKTVVAFPSSASNTKTGKRNYTVDPQTGKYKCNVCSKNFGRPGFQYHYQTVHLKIRYKCNLCEKIFTRKSSYNEHLRTVHLGVRFKCLGCNKQFRKKYKLTLHQRKNVCKL